MHKYYAYDEPGEDPGINVQYVFSVKQILKMGIEKANRFLDGRHRDHEDILYDFIVVNWAYPCDRNGEFKDVLADFKHETT